MLNDCHKVPPLPTPTPVAEPPPGLPCMRTTLAGAAQRGHRRPAAGGQPSGDATADAATAAGGGGGEGAVAPAGVLCVANFVKLARFRTVNKPWEQVVGILGGQFFSDMPLERECAGWRETGRGRCSAALAESRCCALVAHCPLQRGPRCFGELPSCLSGAQGAREATTAMNGTGLATRLQQLALAPCPLRQRPFSHESAGSHSRPGFSGQQQPQQSGSSRQRCRQLHTTITNVASADQRAAANMQSYGKGKVVKVRAPAAAAAANLCPPLPLAPDLSCTTATRAASREALALHRTRALTW